jgi:hypothetical protein
MLGVALSEIKMYDSEYNIMQSVILLSITICHIMLMVILLRYLYAKCHAVVQSIVMLHVITISVVMLLVIMLSVVILSVI